MEIHSHEQRLAKLKSDINLQCHESSHDRDYNIHENKITVKNIEHESIDGTLLELKLEIDDLKIKLNVIDHINNEIDFINDKVSTLNDKVELNTLFY